MLKIFYHVHKHVHVSFLFSIRLSDGGLLISLRGNSYTTYMTEEVDKYINIIIAQILRMLLSKTYISIDTESLLEVKLVFSKKRAIQQSYG